MDGVAAESHSCKAVNTNMSSVSVIWSVKNGTEKTEPRMVGGWCHGESTVPAHSYFSKAAARLGSFTRVRPPRGTWGTRGNAVPRRASAPVDKMRPQITICSPSLLLLNDFEIYSPFQ